MSIWEELEIEATNDQRLIKRAYAKKLKLNRPNENPEGFQRLHAAYKYALNEAKYLSTHSEEKFAADHIEASDLKKPEQASTEEQSVPNNESLDLPASNEVENIENLESQLEQLSSAQNKEREEEAKRVAVQNQMIQLEFERLQNMAEELVKDKTRRNELSCWKTLCNSQLLLDPEFNWRLGTYIFELLGNHNLKNNTKKKKYNRVETQVITFLDEIFFWTDNQFELLNYLDEKICDQVLKRIKNDARLDAEKKAINGIKGGAEVSKVASFRAMPVEYFYFAGNFKRFFAMLFDFICVFLVIFLVRSIFIYFLGETETDALFARYESLSIFIGAAIYLVISFCFEISKFQASPGKLVFGFKVTGKNYSSAGPGRILVRTLACGITGIGGYLTMLLNSWLDGRYLHDRISGTYVIDFQKTHSEHERKYQQKLA